MSGATPGASTWSRPACACCSGLLGRLPLLLVLGTLSFWLREAGIDRTTIGHLSWVGLAYGFKWAWSPLVDRLPIPLLTRWLGRRRSWLLLSQAVIMAGLVRHGADRSALSLTPIVWGALAVAFASATQDIALDAYRIESAVDRAPGALAATYQTGYRIAMIWAGAGVLWIAARAEVSRRVAQYQHGRLADGLSGHGRVDAGGRAHRAAVARAARNGAGAGQATSATGCRVRWSRRSPISSAVTAGRRC
jgi:hypothetical protein